MVEGTVPASIAAGLVLGLATFFSPCAYPLLPGYVGYYATQVDGEATSLAGATVRGLVAGVGVLVALGALLGVGLAVGEVVLQQLLFAQVLVGIVVLVAGVIVLLDMAPTLRVTLPRRRASIAGFGIFGAGYAAASVGCIIPVFIGFVALLLEFSTAATVVAIVTYLGSVTALMVGLTVAAGVGIDIGSQRFSVRTGTLKRLPGAVLVVAGIGQLYLAIVVL